MAKESVLAGTTSHSVNVFIRDNSSTTGAGLAGLAFNTANLICYYTFTGTNATSVAVSLATLAAVNSAWSSGGFKELDATNMKGWYRFDIPNADIAASKGQTVSLLFSGATNMAPSPLEIELTAWNNQDAVRGGMTALPNAAAEAAGGLYTRGTGAGQINQDANGRIDANVKTWIGGTIPAVNVTGVPLVDAKYLLGTVFATPATAGVMDVNAKNINNVSTSSVTVVNANVGTTQPFNFTGTGASALVKGDTVDIAGAAVSTSTAQIGVNVVNVGGTAQTAGDIIGDTNDIQARLPAALSGGKMDSVVPDTQKVDVNTIKAQSVTCGAGVTVGAFVGQGTAAIGVNASGHVSRVALTDTLTTYTGNTPQTGDNFARLGAPAGASVSADVAAVLSAVNTQLPSSPAKNTAFTYVIKMVLASDHVTPATGLTVVMTRSLDGAAFAAATGTVTEISTGHYKVVASAADMNGDMVTHRFAVATADDLTVEMMTVS